MSDVAGRKIIAPGKLVLTGAYAVLEGAPAIVVAVDRYAAVDVASPDDVDVRALHDEAGRKLGLGSSAASMVASHGARAIGRGARTCDRTGVRARIFRDARTAHAQAQGGGSGVDVAASVHGGVLRYVIDADASDATSRCDSLPRRGLGPGRVLERHERAHERPARAGRRAAHRSPSPSRALRIARRGRRRRRRRGGRARASSPPPAPTAARSTPSVTPPTRPSSRAPSRRWPPCAEPTNAAFLPSGAGGGDVAVWLGPAAPSVAFVARAEALGMRPLALSVDRGGVRLQSPSP